MRTTVHVALILIVAAGIGFGIRAFRSEPSIAGPGPDDVVYTNDGADGDIDETEIESVEPSLPPGYTLMSSFELTERSGEQVTSEELLGQPYVVSFFFTTCPGTCMQQNQKLKELQDKFEGQGVRFVAISCDPETDTPEVLREYAARFGADEDQWLFMTGDLLYIRKVGAEVYSIGVDEKFHTEKFILVDAEGSVDGQYSWAEPRQFEKLTARIQEMITPGKES